MKYRIDEFNRFHLIADDNTRRKTEIALAQVNEGIMPLGALEFGVLSLFTLRSSFRIVKPEEYGDLTDAPMIGLRNGESLHRWAFMDYQIRSFLDDFVETGEAIFMPAWQPEYIPGFPEEVNHARN